MTTEFNAKQVFALRLPRSMRMEAVRIAKRKAISLNEFVALAVAEKIARLELLNSEPLVSDKADLEEEGFEVVRKETL
jgi:hypothetical protein